MMLCIKRFAQGIIWPRSHADWGTRQYSRCYAAGDIAQTVLAIVIPVTLMLGIGALIGRLIP